MRITRQHVVVIVGLMICGLLLFAASCGSEQRAGQESGDKKAENVAAGTPAAIEAESAEGQESENAPEKIVTLNQFCAACHYGFSDEDLAKTHEKAGIGCERCHGESERHRSDEDNITPPEMMYPKERIMPTCMMCHPRHEIEHVSLHQQLLAGAKTIFDSDDDDAPQITCTFCHAKKHHIKVRTVRWNKATGELLKD